MYLLNEKTSTWQSNIFGILPHPEAAQILVLPHQAGLTWSLPHCMLNWRMGFSVLEPVTRTMTELLDVSVRAIRCADQQINEEEATYQGIFVLENHNQINKPPLDGRWVDCDSLKKLTLTNEGQRPILMRYLDEVQGLTEVPNRRVWHQPGWDATAKQWIETELQAQGYQLTAPIAQFDSWGLTCLMLAETDQGNVFFKTAPDIPLFANEPLVMQGLATRFPGLVPMPIAIEPEQRWMLLADFGKTFYDQSTTLSVETQSKIIRVFGELQVKAVSQEAELSKIGCLDRRLDHLMDHANALLTDERIMSNLERDEVQRLHAAMPQLNDMCNQLRCFNIPETLIHGDLGMGNVAGTAVQPIFFDWTEAAISHPFFDIFDMFFADDVSKQISIRKTYLSVWTTYESKERLLDAWSLARPLCALYHAISYRNIYNNVESPFKEAMLRFALTWPRRMLQYIDAEQT